MYRISAVSYSNTLPFVYGMERSGLLKCCDLQLQPPALCASRFISGEADIALLPVAKLLSLPEFKVISPYCIGAHQRVNSVFLLSDIPLHEISKIYLDSESETSNALCKVLCKELWSIAPEFETTDVAKILARADNKALVIIGDKAIKARPGFRYVEDLAKSWFDMVRLPFVFAVWVARLDVEAAFITEFEKALQYGVSRLDEVAAIYSSRYPTGFDLKRYLCTSIDYVFDEPKNRSLQLFLSYLK